MPLSKIELKPGIDKERTAYASEGGWYDCDKIRFRKGMPEKIGGWQSISTNTFLGVCRSLHTWGDLSSNIFIGLGTNLKFYISRGGSYFDVTPLRTPAFTLGADPFSTTSGSSIVVVTDPLGGYKTGDFVSFSGATAVGGITIIGEYQITYNAGVSVTANVTPAVSADATIVVNGKVGTIFVGMQIVHSQISGTVTVDSITAQDSTTATIEASSVVTLNDNSAIQFANTLTYTIDAGVNASSTAVGGGGSVVAEYQINTGASVPTAFTGWGGGFWAESAWGQGGDSVTALRLWSQAHFGQDLVFGPRGGSLFYWAVTSGLSARGVLVSSLPNASEVPIQQNLILVADISRFVFCMGTNDVFTTTVDPMLVRWSDQESVTQWSPAATNQSGSLRLSRGSEIVSAIQSRQEVLIWTDAAMYAMQYVGAPDVWTAQLLGENISIASQNAAAYSNGMAFWMGKDKFYVYDGVVKPLPCSVHRHVFETLNLEQYRQVTSGTNEEFHEIWWFYCNGISTTNDSYVVYNYLEDIWYIGTLARTAWLDSGLQTSPIAATYSYNLVNHETGLDNLEDPNNEQPITAYITSAQFDLDDGHNFMFVWRMLPDITFVGSSIEAPSATMTLYPLANSGSGYNDPLSVGSVATGVVQRSSTYIIDEYTEQLNIRVRGRQAALKIESDGSGVQWQLGFPRIDMRPDGRR